MRRFGVLFVLSAAMLTTSAANAHHTPAHTARNIDRAIRHYFPTQYEYARSVARCESNLNRFATGRAGERGLFQIHPGWFGHKIGRYVVDGNRLYQPFYNAKIAAELVRVSGWHHWTCA